LVLGPFTEDSKQRVRDATDLVELAGAYTELRRAGNNRMVGRCPLHDERTPSFTITPSKQLFKCFGCDAGGDALSLVQLKEGLGFPAAAQAAEYLASRGIDDATRERFAVGFALAEKTALVRASRAAGFSEKELKDVGLVRRSRAGSPWQDRFRGRLMFPVCDLQARVLGFGARKLNSQRGPKYVNSPAGASFAKSELLYGAHLARAATQRPVSSLSSRATSTRWRCIRPASSTPLP
jgi:DNA primase